MALSWFSARRVMALPWEPDISPTGHFPAKPKPDDSHTDQIAQADKSPTGNYPVKR